MSETTKVTSEDLQRLIMEETIAFTTENRKTIIKRVEKRLRAKAKKD